MKKPPETRIAELLDCAQRLFFERGYDNTTVNDILEAAGLSKGAFYHYFESKEALLTALSTRLARDSLAMLERLLDDPRLDPIGRLQALFTGAGEVAMELAPQLRATFAVLFKPENTLLFHQADEAGRALALPLIADLLRQGNAAGVMDVPDAEAFADMLLQLRLTMRDVMYKALLDAEGGDPAGAAAALDERLRLYGIAIDRLLGLTDGTIKAVQPGFSRAFFGLGG